MFVRSQCFELEIWEIHSMEIQIVALSATPNQNTYLRYQTSDGISEYGNYFKDFFFFGLFSSFAIIVSQKNV